MKTCDAHHPNLDHGMATMFGKLALVLGLCVTYIGNIQSNYQSKLVKRWGYFTCCTKVCKEGGL